MKHRVWREEGVPLRGSDRPGGIRAHSVPDQESNKDFFVVQVHILLDHRRRLQHTSSFAAVCSVLIAPCAHPDSPEPWTIQEIRPTAFVPSSAVHTDCHPTVPVFLVGALGPCPEAACAWVAPYLARHIEAGSIPESGAPSSGVPQEICRRVWQTLMHIPVGEVRTYTDIARLVYPDPDQARRCVRAVSRMIARNPYGVVVPCHRVIRSDGNVSGYRWGSDLKIHLLNAEGGAQHTKRHSVSFKKAI